MTTLLIRNTIISFSTPHWGQNWIFLFLKISETLKAHIPGTEVDINKQ